MPGARPSARERAEAMADSYFAAHGLKDVPAGYREPLVAAFTPAGESITGMQAQLDEFGARLDAYAGALAERVLRAADERGDLDAAPWPDVELSEEYVRGLEWDLLLGRRAGDA